MPTLAIYGTKDDAVTIELDGKAFEELNAKKGCQVSILGAHSGIEAHSSATKRAGGR